MFYLVKANYIKEKLGEFREKLTDGSIKNQEPDGEEIVESMKLAKITEPETIEWYETCYCETPLKHERETVYDKYLNIISTEIVKSEIKLSGESFWDFLNK